MAGGGLLLLMARLLAALSPLLVLHLAAAHTRAEPLYKQRGALIERRVSDLISKMTLEEKVYQMLGDGMGGLKLCQHFNATSVGSMGWQVSSPADL